MLVLSTQAAVFAASCFVLAPAPGRDALVIDPGAGVAAAVLGLLREHALRPVAVVATHGHADHLWDAAALCDTFGVPLHLGAGDLDRVADPALWLSPGMAEMFESLAGAPWRAPAEVAGIPAAGFDVDGLVVRAVPAPGHTPGSTVLVAQGAPSSGSVLPPTATGRPLPATAHLALTGDVLFAGSIGRTDLPGGDPAVMGATLGRLLTDLPTDSWVLPGHGPISTLAHERATNPYLRPAFLTRLGR